MRRYRQRLHRPDYTFGFTLIELIISLTIISMLVLVIYMAFSIGVSVWEKQDEKSDTYKRHSIMVRLLEDDFSQVSPYTLNWEKGKVFFFSAGPRAVYYVTQNGLGAKARQDKSLFFSCLYLDKSEDGTIGLFLYKTPYPQPEMIQDMQDLRNMSKAQRENYIPNSFIREQAVLILKDLQEPSFSFSEVDFKPLEGMNEDSNATEEKAYRTHMHSEWTRNELPKQMKFSYQIGEKDYFVHTEIDIG